MHTLELVFIQKGEYAFALKHRIFMLVILIYLI